MKVSWATAGMVPRTKVATNTNFLTCKSSFHNSVVRFWFGHENHVDHRDDSLQHAVDLAFEGLPVTLGDFGMQEKSKSIQGKTLCTSRYF
jgi:hypothetical protein